MHIFKQYYSMRTLCKTSNSFIVYCFGSEWKRQVVIEQTQFLSTVFLCGKFKLESIYSGVNFRGSLFFIFFFFFFYFCRIAGKIAKIRTHQNFVPHSIFSFHLVYS